MNLFKIGRCIYFRHSLETAVLTRHSSSKMRYSEDAPRKHIRELTYVLFRVHYGWLYCCNLKRFRIFLFIRVAAWYGCHIWFRVFIKGILLLWGWNVSFWNSWMIFFLARGKNIKKKNSSIIQSIREYLWNSCGIYSLGIYERTQCWCGNVLFYPYNKFFSKFL